MKTVQEVCKENEQFSSIIHAVIQKIGMESIKDVNNYGMEQGFPGFIYYSETVKFWRKYKKSILAMLKNDTSYWESGIVGMVQNFNCLNNTDKKTVPEYTEEEIGEALFGRYNPELDIIYNALAWYAAENVCRMFED